MYKIPLTEAKEKIVQSGKLNATELDQRIKTKINELSGLISEEGAAHIIANELGVELFAPQDTKLKLKEIYAGMRNVSFTAKVLKKYDTREFNKNDKIGKVRSIMVGDDTGTMSVVFWNDQVSLADTFQEEDIIALKQGYVRENNGNKEVHVGEKCTITVNPEGETINVTRQRVAFQRKTIQELQPNEDGAEILGTIVQVFDPRFFNVCSNCGKKVVEAQTGFSCNEHGAVQPSLSYVMNLILDDGTGTIRSVLWKNQTNHLLAKQEQDMSLYKENPSTFEDIKTDLLGEQVKMIGRVQHNQMFDRLELNVQIVEKAKPDDELARLEKKQ